jgi:hypothetical protein
MKSINEKYGYWKVDGVKFDYKFDALRAATLLNKSVDSVEYIFHDPVWDSFDRTQLGKHSLKTLYRERAQQLRDTYDYLILYYSGGSDSHTVLRTFLDNNIKLDEICVKWPEPYRDGKLYVPNNTDTSARNYWSEWDYCVKPVLNILKTTHPEIFINIVDYVGDLKKINMESVFQNALHVRSAGGMIYSTALSTTEKRSIGHIYGVDKPILSFKNDVFNMHFSDTALSVLSRMHPDETNAECFFWTENMPILAYEMAYQTAGYYIKIENDRQYLWGPEKNVAQSTKHLLTDESLSSMKRYQADIAIKVLYDTWDYRFQAYKPSYKPGVTNAEKWHWFAESRETAHLQNQFVSILNDQLSAVDPKFRNRDGTGFMVGVTQGFFVRNLNGSTV